MKTEIVAAALVLAAMLVLACTKPPEARDAAASQPFVTRYEVNGGRDGDVREFHLTDGTRCVTIYNRSITCEWSRATR